MAKITKKSINILMDLYKKGSADTTLVLTNPEDDSTVMEISLKSSLTIAEKGMFVDRVVLLCFDKNGDFMPQYLDPLFMITLLQMTTNVPVIEDVTSVVDEDGNETGEKSTVVNIEKTYELCKAINLVKNVDDEKYQALISELRQMVADKLAYIKEINIRKDSDLMAQLKPLLETIKDVNLNEVFADSLAEFSGKIDRLKSATNNLISITGGK